MKKNPLINGFSKSSVSKNIAEMMKKGHNQKQAIAASLETARKAFRVKHPRKKFPEHLIMTTGMKKNPSIPKAKKVEQGIKLYKNFSGHEPKFIDEYKKPSFPDVAIQIGKCMGIMYETIRDGKREQYLHEFAKSSRPLLISSYDGKQIFLLGGNYDFTEDGIVDRK